MQSRFSRQPLVAFTLVEILVVIGIVALLAALLFPVAGRVRENGRRTVCTSNLRQLGLAFQQYTQDSGGRYPFAGNLQNWANGGHWVSGGVVNATGADPNDVAAQKPTNWDGLSATTYGLAEPLPPFATVADHFGFPEKGALFPYVKNAAAYVCPSAPDNQKRRISYSMNCALASLNTTRIRQPNEIVVLVDEGKSINDGYFWATKDTATTDSLFDAHNGGGNLLFADGHVEFFSLAELKLDDTPDGEAIKWRGNKSPRFHDRAFGPSGSSVFPGASVDSCNAAISGAGVRNWTTEP